MLGGPHSKNRPKASLPSIYWAPKHLIDLHPILGTQIRGNQMLGFRCLLCPLNNMGQSQDSINMGGPDQMDNPLKNILNMTNDLFTPKR